MTVLGAMLGVPVDDAVEACTLPCACNAAAVNFGTAAGLLALTVRPAAVFFGGGII